MPGTFQSAVLPFPMFTIPPSTSGSTIQISSSNGTVSAGQGTSGLTWTSASDSITLTIASTYIGTGRASFNFTPTGGSTQSIPFFVVLSGNSTTSTATNA